MADRSIRLLLTANVTGLVTGLKTAQQALQDTAKRSSDFVTRNEQHISSLSNTLGGLGLAMTAGFGYAAKTFADFDAAMSSVAAATMTTGAELDSLRQAAIDAGAATSFSATEAAGAIENLAKAGISTADILNGALTGSLDLAAAGELDVASAAEIAATAMTQFNLGGEDMAHIADVLAAGAGKAQGDVSDLANALKFAGIPAAQLGVSLEETTGVLALFAKNGILGEQAGTSLRSMLMSLTAPTKLASEEMEKYRINLFDANDDFVGLEQAAGILQSRLGGLTDAERSAALGRIVGNESIGAMNALIVAGAEGVRHWTAAVDDQGYAAEQARLRLDNLKGDLEALSGSFESLILRSGTGANGWLRSMVQGAEEVVDAFGRIPEPVLNLTTLLVGGGGLVALGIAGLGKLAIGINNVKTSLAAMNISMKTAATTAGLLGGAIGVAAAAVAVWATNAANAKAAAEEYATTLDSLGKSTDKTADKLSDRLSGRQINWWDSFVNGGKTAVDLMDEIGIAAEDVRGYVDGEAGAVKRVTAAMQEYADGASFWNKQYGGRSGAVQQLTKWLDEEAAAVERGAKLNADKAALDGESAAAVETNAAAVEHYTAQVEANSEATTKWLEDTSAVFQSFVSLGGAYQGVIDKNREYAESTAASTESSEDSWEDYYDGQSVSAEEYITSLANQVAAQEAWAGNMQALSERLNASMTGEMQDAANSMIDELLTLGPEGAAAVELLRNMSDAELAEVVALYQRKGRASGDEFAAEINSTRPQPIPVTADISNARDTLGNFMATWNGRTIQMNVVATTYSASGGMPGGGTATTPPRASGGGVSSLRTYLVGENGPELFTPQSNGMISSHGATMARAQSGIYTQAPSVNVNVPKSDGHSTTNHVSIATTLPVSERTIRNALHQADLLDPNR